MSKSMGTLPARKRPPFPDAHAGGFTFLGTVIMIAVSILIYSNILDAPFVLDDGPAILLNPHIRMADINLESIQKVFGSYARNRPAANLTLAINYYFGKYQVAGYHAVNIAIHILTGILLFLLLKTMLTFPAAQKSGVYPRLWSPDMIAFPAALLWLVNPLNTESVTYTVQRMNSMSAMFFLLSLFSYINGRKVQRSLTATSGHSSLTRLKYFLWFTGSVLSALLALASKENAAILPAFILLYEWFFFRDLQPIHSRKGLWWILAGTAVISISAILFLGDRPLEMIINTYSGKNFTVFERIITEWRVMIYYIGLILFPWPGRMTLRYDYPVSHSLLDPATTLLSLAAIVCLLTLSAYTAKKNRLVTFAILWFFGTLALESSFLGLALIFEHRTYLPSMMVCLLFIILTLHIFRSKPLVFGVIFFTTVISGYWTYQRNFVWCDEIGLWTDCVKKSPNLPEPRNDLGMALADKGRIEPAIEAFKAATRIDPDFSPAYNNLGLLFQKKGDLKQAKGFYTAALNAEPDFADALNNLGTIYEKQGNIEMAVTQYRAAIKKDPECEGAYINLATALIRLKRFDAAMTCYGTLRKLNPNNPRVYAGMGTALLRQNMIDSAMSYFQNGLARFPDNPDLLVNMGICYRKQGKIQKAISCFSSAARKNPDLAGPLVSLGDIYRDAGDLDSAETAYARALKITPKNTHALINLGEIRLNRNHVSDAEKYFRSVLESDPRNIQASLNLGVVYSMQNKIESAIRQYQKVIRINPDIAEAYNNIGVLMIRSKNIRAAIEQFKRALDIRPNYQSAKDNLNRALPLLNR